MIETIKNRIRNGYYETNKLTEEEVIYISGNDELIDELMKYFHNTEDSNIMLPEYKNTGLSNLNSIIDGLLSKNTDKTNIVNYYYNIFKLYSRINTASLSNVEAIYSFGSMTEEEKNIFEEKVKEYILNTNDNITINNEEKTINFLLENKRYDLFSKVDPEFFYDKDLTKKIINVFPFDKYDIPDILLLKNDFFEIGNTSIEKVLDLCELKFFSIRDKNNKRIDSFYYELLTKMAESNENFSFDAYSSFNSIIHLDESIVDLVPASTIIDIVLKGFVNTELFRKIERDKILSREQVLSIFYDNLKKSDNPYSYMNLIYDYIYPNSTKNRTNDYYNFIMDQMIDDGYGLFFLLKTYDRSYFKEEDIERINKTLINGNNKIKEIDTLNFDILYEDKELLKLIEDSDITIKDLNIKSAFINDDLNKELIKNNEKYNSLKNLILKKQINCSMFEWFDEDIYNMLLDMKEYNKIAFNLRFSDEETRKEIISWLKTKLDNIVLMDDIIYKNISNYNNDIIKSSDLDIIKLALKNENLINKTMKRVIHNDNLIDKIDDEVFDITKNYYSNKYKLGLRNMELLVSNLGPKILLHLEDENLQRIINMDEEELKKIISLFPMEGTLIDIEATHESIMQYAFKQDESNREDVNLFNLLKMSIVDKNNEDIQKYKYKIMSLIDLNYFDKIKNNYYAIKNLTLEETLDYLIYNFNNTELRDLFHSLTANAISTKRKLYVGNKYFMDSEEFKKSSLFGINNKIMNNYNIVTELGISNDLLRKSEKAINNLNIDYLFDNMSKENRKIILRKYNYSNYEEMKNYIIENLNKPKSYSILEDMMNNAITYAKSNSKGDYSVFAQLKVDYDLDEKSVRNELEKHIIKYCSIVSARSECTLEDLIAKELEKQGISNKLTRNIAAYYNDLEKQELLFDNEEEIKKNIGKFFKTATRIVREDFDHYLLFLKDKEKFINLFDKNNQIKRLYKFDTSKSDVYSILSLLNLDLVRENVLNDDRNYNLLLKIMNKTKIHLLDKGVSSFIEKNSLPVTSDFKDISAYFNYFGDIVTKEEENLVKKGITTSLEDNIPSIVSVLIQSGIYASVNSIYSKILGVEDSKLIKANPSPNTAIRKTKNNERLNQAIEDTIKCFKRKEILVPTFDDIITLSEEDNKKIEVIVGNFTAPCNLTHGERTGACMRIGGMGEALYDFCLNNKAGFHIRFEDPDTHKYISRVSCFRNGNTVYFNQLRESLDEKYSNSELMKTTEIISNKLIELTKESDNPIENVFVTEGYSAMDSNKIYHLNHNDVINGLGKIYTDYSYSDSILLATAAKKDYVPLKPGNNNIKPYKVQRTKPREYMNPVEATGVINRISSVKQLLNGVDVSDIIDLEFDSDIIYTIASDDWYIYVDNNMQIKTDIIDNSIDSVLERNTFMSLLEQQIKQGEFKEVSYGL